MQRSQRATQSKGTVVMPQSSSRSVSMIQPPLSAGQSLRPPTESTHWQPWPSLLRASECVAGTVGPGEDSRGLLLTDPCMSLWSPPQFSDCGEYSWTAGRNWPSTRWVDQEALPGGRSGEEGQDSPLTRGGGAAEPSFRCQNQVQSRFCQKLCDLGQITLSIPCALVSSPEKWRC